MLKQDVGMVGLGVMGRNLALNMENKGYRVSVYSHFNEETEKFIVHQSQKKLKGVL